MTTRKGRKFKPRRTARGHRHSNTGVLDVRSEDGLAKFVKLLGNGKTTIVVVYADWCGHCHEFIPHFDKASKNSNHTTNQAKVNETMLPKVNEAMKKRNATPLDVEGYPSVIAVTNNTNVPIEPVKDTEVMTNVMNQSGTLAEEAGLASLPAPTNQEMAEPDTILNTSIGSTSRQSPPSVKKLNSSTTPDFVNMGEEEGVSVDINTTANKKNNTNNNENNTHNNKNNTANSFTVSQLEKQTEELASLRTTNGPSIASPSRMNDDMEESTVYQPSVKGGSLYSAMAQTAYTLAAPAALLATAALIMRRKSRGKRHHHKKRRTRK
jgi:thiol-disulfide isomerase/thioredoxin